MTAVLATFSRTLTSADRKRHLPFAVQVPAGTTQLTMRLTFSPAMVDDIKNMLTLSVFDPSGWRGAGHRHGTTHEVVISAQHATHGYRAGAIQAGEWTVVVDTHMIMPGVPCPIHLEVSATNQPPTSNLQLPTSNLQPPNPNGTAATCTRTRSTPTHRGTSPTCSRGRARIASTSPRSATTTPCRGCRRWTPQVQMNC